MSYAQLADVQTRLGRPLTDDEKTQAETLLDDVELEIRSRIPDLDDRIANGDLSEDVVIRVEASAVKRVIQNPDGYTSETDGDYTYQLNPRLSSGELDITEHEWTLLGVGSGAFVIRLGCRIPVQWVPVDQRFVFPVGGRTFT